MGEPHEALIVGQVSGVYGVRGWVRIRSHTRPLTALLDYPNWLLGRDGEFTPAGRVAAKSHGKGLIARLELADNRNAAAELVGADIAIDRDELAPAAPGEYYWADLVGLEVSTASGRSLGSVDHLIETGANDVMVVRGDNGETLVPFVMDEVVKEVDTGGGRIVVDWDWE